jgi:hypothetical protein
LAQVQQRYRDWASIRESVRKMFFTKKGKEDNKDMKDNKDKSAPYALISRSWRSARDRRQD